MSKYSKYMAWSTANSQHKKAVFSETVDKDGSWAEMNSDMENGRIDSKGVASAALAIAYADHCVAEIMVEYDAFKKEYDLLAHKLICCHVAADHPDPMLSRTGVYIEKWDSQSAEAVRKLRDERDTLQAERDQLSKACDQRAAHEYKLMGEVAALKTAQWQPIETAPKDGKVVIALLPDGDVQKSWYFAPSSTTKGWMTSGGNWIEPIGWISCPQNPQEQPK